MIEVRVKRKKRGLFVVPIVLCVFILWFSFSDADSLWFLRSLHTSSFASELYWRAVEQQIVEETGDSTLDSATSGYGLNLLLIDNIQTEQYAKELLQLCADNELGNLDLTERNVYVPLQTTLGIWYTETGLYPSSVLLKSDLPWDDTAHAPVWNTPYGGLPASALTLKGYDKGVRDVIGSSIPSGAAVGPLQYEPGNSSASKTNCSGYSNGERESGDAYYTPDQIAGLNNYLERAVSALGFTDASKLQHSPGAITTLTALTHNMSCNGVLGIPANKSVSAYVDVSKLTDEKRFELASSLSTSLNTMFDSVQDRTPIYGADTSMFQFISVVLLVKDGWLIDDPAYNSVTGYSAAWKKTAAVNIWNAVNPDSPISNYSELGAKLSSYRSTVATATGYSISEVDAKYGTTSGSFVAGLPTSWRSQRNSGTIFRVSDETSSMYVAGESKIVQAFTVLQVSHVTAAVLQGGYRYACMLQYAGVNVDPSNPSTYTNSLGDEWGATLDDWMTAYGIDASQMSESRLELLRKAKENVDKVWEAFGGQAGTYVWGANHSYAGEAPDYSKGFDCSSFVKWTYMMAGYDGLTIPGSTSGYPGNSNWVRSAWSDLKPGDVLRRNGHVVIYLGTVEDLVWTVEAKGTNYGVGFFSKKITQFNSTGESSDAKLTPYIYNLLQ